MDPVTLYFLSCVAVGWFGRDRLVGFWGCSLLAFFVSPLLVAAGIAMFTTAKSRPATTAIHG